MYEVELKFPVTDAAALQGLLEQLGAEFSAPIQQQDEYFTHPVRNFVETDEALRMRQVGQRSWITYKGPKVDSQTKTRREIDLPLAEAWDQGRELLLALGFAPALHVRKQRIPGSLLWQGETVEIALDEVESLGHFIEFERQADESQRQAATESLLALAEHLGLRASETRGYADLIRLRQQGKID